MSASAALHLKHNILKDSHARLRMVNPHAYIPLQMGLRCYDCDELAFPVQHHQQQ